MKTFLILSFLILPIFVFGQTTTVDCGAGKRADVTTVNGVVRVACNPSVSPTPTPTPKPIIFPPGIYAATTGKPDGRGTPDDPKDIASALNAEKSGAKPGDTIWLRGGRYFSGGFRATLRGDLDKPITVRGFPGERVTLLAPAESWAVLIAETPGITYRDFEIAVEESDRTKGRAAAIYCTGANNRFINLVIRDTGGVGLWTPAIDAELYGCIIYGTGWLPASGGRGHGHNLYLQNDAGTKRITDNFIFSSYGYGIHAYAQAAQLKGFEITGNTIFDSGILASDGSHGEANILIGGTQNAAERVKITGNVLYQGLSNDAVNAYLYFQARNNDLEFSGNYVAGGCCGFWAENWLSLKGTGNTMVGSNLLTILKVVAGAPNSSYAWNGNYYWFTAASPNPAPFYFRDGSGVAASLDYAHWRALGFDATSTFTSGAKPANAVFVRPNQYEPGRAALTVINWSGAQSQAVDLSGVLVVGDSFMITRAADFYGAPIMSGVYSGGLLSTPIGNGINALVLRMK